MLAEDELARPTLRRSRQSFIYTKPKILRNIQLWIKLLPH